VPLELFLDRKRLIKEDAFSGLLNFGQVVLAEEGVVGHRPLRWRLLGRGDDRDLDASDRQARADGRGEPRRLSRLAADL
jgi:hypothetical protein